MILKGLLAVITAALVALTTPALGKARYPSYWVKQSRCIRYHESRNHWHIRDGGFQIIRSTWQSFKPRTWPAAAEWASPAKQTFVAWRIWIHNGRSWGNNNQWPNTARVCGVY